MNFNHSRATRRTESRALLLTGNAGREERRGWDMTSPIYSRNFHLLNNEEELNCVDRFLFRPDSLFELDFFFSFFSADFFLGFDKKFFTMLLASMNISLFTF